MKEKKNLLKVANQNNESSEDMIKKTLEYREKDLELKEEILSTLKKIETKINNNL